MKYLYLSTFLILSGINISGQLCNVIADHVLIDCKPYLNVNISVNFFEDCGFYRINGDTTFITWGFSVWEDCKDAYWHCPDKEIFTWENEFIFLGDERHLSLNTLIEINEPHKPHAIFAGIPCAFDSGLSCFYIVQPGDSLPYTLITVYDTILTVITEVDTIAYYDTITTEFIDTNIIDVFDTIQIFDTIEISDTIPVYLKYDIESGIDTEELLITITAEEILCNFPFESIKIYSLDGILLNETTNISNLPKGVYILDLQYEGYPIRMKFLKQ